MKIRERFYGLISSHVPLLGNSSGLRKKPAQKESLEKEEYLYQDTASASTTNPAKFSLTALAKISLCNSFFVYIIIVSPARLFTIDNKAVLLEKRVTCTRLLFDPSLFALTSSNLYTPAPLELFNPLLLANTSPIMNSNMEEVQADIPGDQIDYTDPDHDGSDGDDNFASGEADWGENQSCNETAQSSISAGSEFGEVVKEGEWDDSSAPNWEEYTEELPTLSFKDPLSLQPGVLEIYYVAIDGELHPFLTAFLHRRRYTDIPFGTAHRLLNWIMHLVEEGIFQFLQQHTPDEKFVQGSYGPARERTCADELEVQFWVRHLMDNYLRMFQHILAGQGVWNSLETLRNYAVHSWVYDTHLIRAAVGTLALIKDEQRLSTLEQVLEITYHMYRQPKERDITEVEKRIVDEALGFIPAKPTTLHQLLSRVQELLENACYNFWQKHNPHRLAELQWHFSDTTEWTRLPPNTTGKGWDCPERVELQRWHDARDLDWNFEKFPPRTKPHNPGVVDKADLMDLLQSAGQLRNCVAHRDYKRSERPLKEMLCLAQDLASALDDAAAAKEIEALLDTGFLQPIFEDQEAAYLRRYDKFLQVDSEARVNWQDFLFLEILEDTIKLRAEEASDAGDLN